AFNQYTDKKGYCNVGSAKAHIGHTAAASGVVGLIKVLLSLRHKVIPGLMHFNRLNSLIKIEETPFIITASENEWKAENGTARMAALNSFGHSGTNAHIVIKEYIQSRPKRKRISVGDSNGIIIPLSAKSDEQLLRKINELIEYVASKECRSMIQSGEIELNDVAYTLQIGREMMDERVGFIVHSIDQLVENGKAFCKGMKNCGIFCRGSVKHGNSGMKIFSNDAEIEEAVNKWILHGKLSKLLEIWVNGFEFDWNKLYEGDLPKRISLPAYPFAKERYWIESANDIQYAAESAREAPTYESIKDVIEKIDAGLLDSNHGTALLRSLT
ncbi:MAG: hypothetical protein GF344_10700, partial [Chitinivibrionales bacterium]|nr:hypothetical protein [Chitinivibrionales bacterium]